MSETSGSPVARLDVLVTGASGLVGTALCTALSTSGHRVRRLVRRSPAGDDEFRWNPLSGDLDQAAVEGTDCVVHLAGENIAGRRWTRTQKDRLFQSRVEGTRLLAQTMRSASRGPAVLVAASAIGAYGDRGDDELDESCGFGGGFLADLCRAWEAESRVIEGARTVQLRFGVVLSPEAGALKKMLLPFRLGVGGRIGHGRQWVSWLTLDDAVGAIIHALSIEGLQGPVNGVVPEPSTNAEFTRTLGRVLARPTILPMPAFAARLALGELADEALLTSQRVIPKRLLETGYNFAYPDLEGALRHLLFRKARRG